LLHFGDKKYLNDVHVGCDGACKPMSVIDFLTLEFITIEENNKFIEEQCLFEENLNLNF
jgi:hypothetical protein